MEEMQKKIGPLSTLDDHKSTAHFRKAFDKQSNYIETAIKSLNSLDEQIIQFLFTPKASDIDFDHDFSTKDRESLCNSMALMRRLLLDAQGKFRKMVDDNKQLAERIDSSIGLATQEVNVLRGQLAETNRRLNEMQDYGELVDLKMSSTLNSTANTTLPDNDVAAPGAPQRSNQDAEEICQLREENGKLKKTIQTLRQEVEEMRCSIKTSNTSDASKVNELKLDLIQTKQELHRARDALQAMKADRKRLKAEKLDLLGQMKQLYCTLEDKESELRDFIRNYEQRMAESDQNIKQLGSEKEECDREKWEIMNKARETAEKMVSVRAELDAKDLKIQQMEMEISQMRERLSSGAMTCGMRTSMASEVSIPSPGHGQNPMEEDLAFRTPPPDPPNSARSVKSGDSCQSNTSSSAQNSTVQNGSIENLAPIGESSRSSEDLNDGMYVTISPEAKKKKRRSLVAFSKMFNKAKSRRSLASAEGSLILDDGPSSPGSRLSMLCQENYADKLATLQAAKLMPMVNWKASHVLAWLEIDVYMPMYGRVCAENIKSGKILLGLSDSELDSALNIQRPLHRRKLRLAIEEYRDPNATKYPKAGSLDHTYVSHRWLADLGLPQYMSVFEGHLVDGRILNNLNKKDLEKHLQVTRRFHQASILHGIELLRRIDFDKETLNLRRSSCEDNDSDLLVWTNQRLVEWVRSIDLEEYADCLLESGVHGAVLVLEPTFNVESLASLLSIPPTKSYVRRHLASELDLIVKPARVERPVRQALESSSKRKSSLGFVRTYRGGSTSGDEDSGRGSSGKGRLSFRRAFSN